MSRFRLNRARERNGGLHGIAHRRRASFEGCSLDKLYHRRRGPAAVNLRLGYQGFEGEGVCGPGGSDGIYRGHDFCGWRDLAGLHHTLRDSADQGAWRDSAYRISWRRGPDQLACRATVRADLVSGDFWGAGLAAALLARPTNPQFDSTAELVFGFFRGR